MSKKIDRTPHEPGWSEVILGAALSVGLGAMLGAVALVFKPVVVVAAMTCLNLSSQMQARLW
jgi:hypothetical protein